MRHTEYFASRIIPLDFYVWGYAPYNPSTANQVKCSSLRSIISLDSWFRLLIPYSQLTLALWNNNPDIAAIDSLAFDELENNVNIALMKGIIDGSFSGNQVTYTLDRANRNYIIEMVMNAEASSAYFLYPAIAESFIKSIKSNCEKICKDFYESGTKAYDVDCTFIMDDCYGGEIFTIVNGEVQ